MEFVNPPHCGSSNLGHKSGDHSIHRCLACWMGCAPRCAHGVWDVVSAQIPPAHQLPRVTGSLVSPSTLRGARCGEGGPSDDRQYYGSRSTAESGRHVLRSPSASDGGPTPLDRPESYHFSRQTASWEAKCDSRWPLEKGTGSLPRSSQLGLEGVGSPAGRLVCEVAEPQVASVGVSTPEPGSLASRFSCRPNASWS